MLLQYSLPVHRTTMVTACSQVRPSRLLCQMWGNDCYCRNEEEGTPPPLHCHQVARAMGHFPGRRALRNTFIMVPLPRSWRAMSPQSLVMSTSSMVRFLCAHCTLGVNNPEQGPRCDDHNARVVASPRHENNCCCQSQVAHTPKA